MQGKEIKLYMECFTLFKSAVFRAVYAAAFCVEPSQGITHPA